MQRSRAAAARALHRAHIDAHRCVRESGLGAHLHQSECTGSEHRSLVVVLAMCFFVSVCSL